MTHHSSKTGCDWPKVAAYPIWLVHYSFREEHVTQLRPMKGEMFGEVMFWKRGSSLLFPGNFQKGPTLPFWREKEVREMEPG